MNKEKIQMEIRNTVEKVKQTNPMAGSITNTVTIKLVANVQIAIGGSAAMIYLPDEAEMIAKSGGAMFINMGTMFPIYEKTLPRAAKTLHKENKNWVLDPVAIGTGELRMDILRQFKEYKPSIIRGNPSEIIALAGLWNLEGGVKESQVRGVDSTNQVDEAKDAAVSLANWIKGAVLVTGEVDLVTDGSVLAYSHGGSEYLANITGGGDSLGGAAAIYATSNSPFIAALTAISVFNLAGARAEKKAQGPGSFEPSFLDELYLATSEDISKNRLEIKEL